MADPYAVDVYWEPGLAGIYYRVIEAAPAETVDGWTVTAERLAELQAMPYGEYLETPEWRYRRRQLIKWREYKCERCSDHRGLLNVHHRTYERLGNEDPDDLEVLCRACDALEHRRQP
jgi:hypothetical protein